MTTKTDAEAERALLPCPFCGGEPILKQYRADGLRISCQSCHVKYEQRWLYKNRDWLAERMTETWNRRAALQSQDREDAGAWYDRFMELSRDLVVANRALVREPTTAHQKLAAEAAVALQVHARRRIEGEGE